MYKQDLALYILEGLICYKNHQPTNQLTNRSGFSVARSKHHKFQFIFEMEIFIK